MAQTLYISDVLLFKVRARGRIIYLFNYWSCRYPAFDLQKLEEWCIKDYGPDPRMCTVKGAQP